MATIISGTNGVEAQTGGFLADSTYGGSFTAGTVVDYTSSLGRISVGSGADLAFYRGGIATTEAMRIKSNGQLLLQGNTAEATNLATSASNAAILLRPYTGSSWATAFGSYSGQIQYIQGVDAAGTTARDITIQPFGGNVLVGATTTPSSTVKGFGVITYASGFYLINAVSTTGSVTHFSFTNPNGQVGHIDTSGSATSYVTSSDYRLKENIAPMTGALEKVALLKPVTYTWKVDGSAGEGFIAHELQEYFPDAVSGTKDAVDADGNPVYQGIDTSFLVATLTKAIQEQQELIKALTSRIETLEAK